MKDEGNKSHLVVTKWKMDRLVLFGFALLVTWLQWGMVKVTCFTVLLWDYSRDTAHNCVWYMRVSVMYAILFKPLDMLYHNPHTTSRTWLKGHGLRSIRPPLYEQVINPYGETQHQKPHQRGLLASIFRVLCTWILAEALCTCDRQSGHREEHIYRIPKRFTHRMR